MVWLVDSGTYLNYLLALNFVVLGFWNIIEKTLSPETRFHSLIRSLTATSCCILLGKLGISSHSGFNFWQRLTVHDDNTDIQNTPPEFTSNSFPFIRQLGDLWPEYRNQIFSFAFLYPFSSVCMYMLSKRMVKSEDGQGESRYVARDGAYYFTSHKHHTYFP